METTEASKIELILGDAVRLLVESGASASVVGPFALKFGAKIAQRLAVPEPTPVQKQDPDLQAIVQATVEAVVNKTLTLQLQSAGAKSVRLKVWHKEAPTTVSLPQLLINKAIDHWGDKRSANAQIRALFEKAPADVKIKSRWLSEELRKQLSS